LLPLVRAGEALKVAETALMVPSLWFVHDPTLILIIMIIKMKKTNPASHQRSELHLVFGPCGIFSGV